MFDSRATATEFLDRPDCDPALAAASYRFMEMVNRRFGGIRLVRRFLATGEEPCTPAPVGTFVDVEGATEATPCPPGCTQRSARPWRGRDECRCPRTS